MPQTPLLGRGRLSPACHRSVTSLSPGLAGSCCGAVFAAMLRGWAVFRSYVCGAALCFWAVFVGMFEGCVCRAGLRLGLCLR